ncbi:MAG: hypothetical protein GEU81_09825 [Nitriliruptorales bacterium]|nr:hypothetical protein [Nitriliruptorales bacterium]
MRNGLLIVLAAVGLVGLTALLTTPPATSEAETVSRRVSKPPEVAEPEPALECTPAPIEKRAAQLLVVGLPGVVTGEEPLAQELTEIGVGGVLLQKPNVADPEQVRALIEALRSRSEAPILVSADEEPGRVSTFRSLIGGSPSARTLAAEKSVEEIRNWSRDLGVELSDLGVDLDLGPVVDLDGGDPRGIIGDRSFSLDPALTTSAGLAFSEGLIEAGVLAAAKHFPGHGRSPTDSHVSLATVEADLGDLRATDLAPFQAQIDAGVPVVMLAHVGFSALDPNLPASLDPNAYALLREMGFQGVAMTDSLGMGAVNTTWSYTDAAVKAVAAGADSLLASDGNQARAMRDALVAAVNEGRLSESRVDEAAARMLVLKGADPGLLACTGASTPAMAARVHQQRSPTSGGGP